MTFKIGDILYFAFKKDSRLYIVLDIINYGSIFIMDLKTSSKFYGAQPWLYKKSKRTRLLRVLYDIE